jgi:hypothetical protein
VLRRHEKCARKGEFKLSEEDRIFNPSRETARLLAKVKKLGPHTAHLAHEIFARLGRPGQKAIYALSNLARHHKRDEIERACEQVLTLSTPSYQALKRILMRNAAAEEATAAAQQPSLRQVGDHIRDIDAYQAFWEEYSQLPEHDPSTSNRNS